MTPGCINTSGNYFYESLRNVLQIKDYHDILVMLPKKDSSLQIALKQNVS